MIEHALGKFYAQLSVLTVTIMTSICCLRILEKFAMKKAYLIDKDAGSSTTRSRA